MSWPAKRAAGSGSSINVSAGKSVSYQVQEGDALTVKGNSATGTVQRIGPSGSVLQTWTISSGTQTIGPYSGTQQFLVSCSAGSIDVSVGDGVLSVQSITSQKRSPVLPCRIHVSLPTPPVATDGAAHTYDVQIPAKRAYSGVRFIHMNLNTAAVMNISASRCGSSPKHLTALGTEISWWPNLLTVNGASSWSVPVAKAAAKVGHVIPGFSITDHVPLAPVARTDSATYGSNPLVRVRSRIPAEVQYPYQVGAFAAAWNAYAGNGGMIVGSTLTNSDFATSPPTDNSYTLTEGGGALNPVIALFSYTVPGRSIFAFGDSLFQGVGSSIGNGGAANGFLGWPTLVHCQAPLIDTLNMAVSGQKTEDSLAVMKALLNAMDDMPTYAAIKVYSPNDGTPSQASIDLAWGRILDAVSWLRTKGVTPILFTSPPVNSWDATAHSFNESQNARAVALAASLPWVVLVDMCGVVRDPANNRQILPAYNYDGTHLLTAGYQAIADSVMATLGS